MTQNQEWSAALHQRIAQAIRAARGGRMSAQELADATEQLGYPISRSQIANYESGRKQGLDVAELLVIAGALRVPPITLLFGGPPDADVQLLPPGTTAPAFFAMAWFAGDRELAWPGPGVVDPDDAFDQWRAVVDDPELTAAKVLEHTRERARLHRDLVLSHFVAKREAKTWDDEQFDRAVLADAERLTKIDEINAEIADLVATSKEEGQTE
jgi:transcriptional regulator with XRE-family HTH domain